MLKPPRGPKVPPACPGGLRTGRALGPVPKLNWVTGSGVFGAMALSRAFWGQESLSTPAVSCTTWLMYGGRLWKSTFLGFCWFRDSCQELLPPASPQEVRAPAGELVPASGCLPEAAGGVRGVGRTPEASLQDRDGVALEALCLLFSLVDSPPPQALFGGGSAPFREEADTLGLDEERLLHLWQSWKCCNGGLGIAQAVMLDSALSLLVHLGF